VGGALESIEKRIEKSINEAPTQTTHRDRVMETLTPAQQVAWRSLQAEAAVNANRVLELQEEVEVLDEKLDEVLYERMMRQVQSEDQTNERVAELEKEVRNLKTERRSLREQVFELRHALTSAVGNIAGRDVQQEQRELDSKFNSDLSRVEQVFLS